MPPPTVCRGFYTHMIFNHIKEESSFLAGWGGTAGWNIVYDLRGGGFQNEGETLGDHRFCSIRKRDMFVPMRYTIYDCYVFGFCSGLRYGPF